MRFCGVHASFARPAWQWAAILCIASLLSTACSHGPAETQPTPAHAAAASPAATTVSSDEIARAPGETLDHYLSGRMSGVIVSQTGGGVSIRIRGASSVHGNNDPLYVVDGIVTDPGPNGTLSINPYDIASIRVLKDAADITMYGVRGANGVIVIKTKRASSPHNE